MNLASFGMVINIVNFPRASGDEPQRGDPLVIHSSFSPREWG